MPLRVSSKVSAPLGRTACTAKGHHETVHPDEHEGGILDEIHIVGSDHNAYLAFHAVGFGECCGSQESVGGYHLFFFFLPEGVGACLNSLSLTVAVSRFMAPCEKLRKSENTRASSALSFAEARECFSSSDLQSHEDEERRAPHTFLHSRGCVDKPRYEASVVTVRHRAGRTGSTASGRSAKTSGFTCS